MTTDRTVLTEINRLSDEEHQLKAKQSQQTATDLDRQRIAEIDAELDRCWDLLRQRRARRGAGLDPDEAKARTTATVQHYIQ